MHHDAKRKLSNVRILLRVLGVGFAGLVVLCSLLVVLVGFVVWRVVERSDFDVDPAAVQKAVQYAVVATLKEGEREQKLETINELSTMGPDAKLFVDGLVEAAADDDSDVRDAAIDALRMIDPGALDRLDDLDSM